MAGLLPSVARGFRAVFNGETKGMSLRDPASFDEVMRGSESETGRKVNEKDAISIAPLWQAVSILAGDVGATPRYVMRRLPNDDREYATGHNINRVLAYPNETTTSVRLFRQLMTHALIWGNGYLYIDRPQLGGKVLGLYLLLPDRTVPVWVDGALHFKTHVMIGKQAVQRVLPNDSVIQLQGLSLDGQEGCNLVAIARNTWGLALENINFASKFYRRGGRVGGILEIPGSMNKIPVDKIEQGFREKYENPDKAFTTIIAREGIKFHAAQMSPEQTQMVESREADARAAARFTCMPPSKLGIQGSVSYNSLEHEQRSYLTGTLWRWFELIQAELALKLLTIEERDTHYIEHNVSKLIEADTKTMNEVLEIQRRNEVINANEWRRKINLNKREDAGGDTYENPNTKSNSQSDNASDPPSNAITKARVIFDVERHRVACRVGRHVRKAAKKPADLQSWIDAGGVDYKAVAASELAAACELLTELGQFTDATAEGCAVVDKIVSAVSPFLDPPHKATDLLGNVERVLAKIEHELEGAK